MSSYAQVTFTFKSTTATTALYPPEPQSTLEVVPTQSNQTHLLVGWTRRLAVTETMATDFQFQQQNKD